MAWPDVELITRSASMVREPAAQGAADQCRVKLSRA